jgi:O-Antigen ligase
VGWRLRRLDIAVALFAAATVLSLTGMTTGMDRQLAALSVALAGFRVLFLTSRTAERSTDLWLIVGALIAATLLQAATTAVAVLTGALTVSEGTRVSAELADPNHFAGILVLVCLLLVALGISVRTTWATIPTALASIALSIALLATLSRSGWLGLLVGVVLLFVLLPARRWQLAAVAGVVALVVLSAGLTGPISARLSPHATGPWEMLASRWRVWTAAVAMTSDHPLFGVGLDNFRVYYPLYSVRPLAVDHAHNLFLNIIAERGILALLTFINLLFAYFLTIGKVLRRVDSGLLRALGAGLIASVGGYLVHSLFDVSYYDPQVLFLVWILIGLAAALPSVVAERALLPSAVDAPAEQQQSGWEQDGAKENERAGVRGDSTSVDRRQ